MLSRGSLSLKILVIWAFSLCRNLYVVSLLISSTDMLLMWIYTRWDILISCHSFLNFLCFS